MAKSSYVLDVSEADFQRLVLDASLDKPVIVDFWAPWCGPCKTLGPVLEELAEAYGGAFLLAKVNVDENQQLAAAARISSIPTLLAVFGGGMVDQIQGALPKAQLKQWIDALLKHAGVEANPGAKPDPNSITIDEWQARLDKNPADGEALHQIGRHHLRHGDYDQAKAYLANVPADSAQFDSSTSFVALIDLLSEVEDAGGVESVRAAYSDDPDDALGTYLFALTEAAAGDLPVSAETLVNLVASAPSEVRDKAKVGARVVLACAGREDSRVEAARRRLAGLLF
ncbi:MAG: thioredoxin [Myxococcales bacterium]|nr:thioredoxin [Myxococcales bacterium]